ncbi:plasmid mobilization protein [Rhizosphaericola mali]|uniref:Mobilization protein n=1 Tax=Rhizosphaericola mali TaxID=2545455 RepID=A0A5P2G4R4_9BACT|nr:hypothetical protein [Rhizosphaericola mali]QES88083.1 hypothetical protein E0W69_005185 [Rhizosphaericola mali]
MGSVIRILKPCRRSPWFSIASRLGVLMRGPNYLFSHDCRIRHLFIFKSKYMKNKTRRLNILVTPEEYLSISSKARQCELPISHFLIEASRKVHIKMYRKTIPASVSKVVLALTLTASNFNQLVRHLHQGKIQHLTENELKYYGEKILLLAGEIKNTLQ